MARETLKLRLASELQKDSIVDGEGLRTVIWFQGCPHNCKGCHNPHSHSFTKGILTDITKIKEYIASLKDQDGITFSGGEPFSQPEALLEIAKYVKEQKLNIWLYTGYTFEQLLNMSEQNPLYLDILKITDVLVDGKFILEEKSLNMKFRGSKNQRILDCKKSIKDKRPVLIQKYRKEKKVKLNIY